MQPPPTQIPVNQQHLFIRGERKSQRQIGSGGGFAISRSGARHQNHAILLFGLPANETKTRTDIAEALGIHMPGILRRQEGETTIGIRSFLRNLSVNRFGEMLAKLHHGGDAIVKTIQQKEKSTGKNEPHAQADHQGADEARFDGDGWSGPFQNVDVELTDVLTDINVLHGPQKPVVKLLLSIPLGLHLLVFRHFSAHIQRLGLGFCHEFLQIGHLQLNGLPLFRHGLLALLPNNLEFSLPSSDFVLQGKDLRVLGLEILP